MSARVIKHSLVIAGHRTSISLEDAFWRALKDCASARGLSLPALVKEIDSTRGDANLSSAIRVYLFKQAQGLTPSQPT
jgi:predicted DNA-binding ribbon-helix-helix protein